MQEYERAVIFRLGRVLPGARGPGKGQINIYGRRLLFLPTSLSDCTNMVYNYRNRFTSNTLDLNAYDYFRDFQIYIMVGSREKLSIGV